MKKAFKILILLLILDTFSLFAQEEYKNRVEPYKIWQAKKVTVFHYNAVKKNKKIIKQGLTGLFVSNDSKEYDANGSIKKFISYNSFGEVALSEYYKYDTLGNLIERYVLAKEQDTISKSLMYYKDTLLVKQLDYGRVIDTNIMDSIKFKIGLIGINNYQYNNMDKLAESDYESINRYPIKQSKTKYTLDESFNIIKIINLSFDTIEFIIELEYDQNGNIIDKREFDSKGGLFTRVKYQYDKNSRLIWEERKNSPADEEITYIYKYIGDDVVEIESNSKTFKSKRKYEYSYDEFGNWFQRIEDVGGDSYIVTERKIEY